MPLAGGHAKKSDEPGFEWVLKLMVLRMKVILSFLMLWTELASAEIYKWVDDKGGIFYSDIAPADRAGVVDLKRVDKVREKIDPSNSFSKGRSHDGVPEDFSGTNNNVINDASRVDEKFSYYEIDPIGEKTVYKELDGKTPIAIEEQKYLGSTDWNVSWRYYFRNSSNECYINVVYTDVDIKYTMPKLRQKRGVTLDRKRKFDAYYDALLLHEKGHGELAVKAAKEIERVLPKTDPASNCEAVGEKANGVGLQILNKYKQLQEEYDEKTGHGEEQGASASKIKI